VHRDQGIDPRTILTDCKALALEEDADGENDEEEDENTQVF